MIPRLLLEHGETVNPVGNRGPDENGNQQRNPDGNGQVSPIIYSAPFRALRPLPFLVEEDPGQQITEKRAQGIHQQIIHVRGPEAKQLQQLNQSRGGEARQGGCFPAPA